MGVQVDNTVLLSEIGQMDMPHMKVNIFIVGMGREDGGKKALGRSKASNKLVITFSIKSNWEPEPELFKEYKCNYSQSI